TLPRAVPLLRRFSPIRSAPKFFRVLPFRWTIFPSGLRAAPHPLSALAAPAPASVQTYAPPRSPRFRPECSSLARRVSSLPANRCCLHQRPRGPPHAISALCPATPESPASRFAQSAHPHPPTPPQSCPSSSARRSVQTSSVTPLRAR